MTAAVTLASMGNGPAFSASIGSFNVSQSSNTLAPMSTEDFDTAGCYNNTGSTVGGIPAYAFKPTVAGYYIVSFGTQYQGPAYTTYFVATLLKNGSGVKESVAYAAQYAWAYGSTVLYLNGTSDYIQINAFQESGVTRVMAANMSAALVRGA